jgi:hypothetical protein
MGGAGIYEIRRGGVYFNKGGELIRSDTVPRITPITTITEFVRQPAAYIDIPEPD